MTPQTIYEVYPETRSNLKNYSGTNSNLDTPSISTLLILDIYIGIGWSIYNLLMGSFDSFGSFTFLAIAISLFLISKYTKNQQRKLNVALTQSESITNQLNEILHKSHEIATTILPFFEESTQKILELAKIDFSENAISPFWDRVEEVGKLFECYKESADQLRQNCELYTNMLDGKNHNFPHPFPIETSASIPQQIIDEYNGIVRKAQTKYEFASIWEHRNTQKILNADFATFEQAKNSIIDSIVTAIADLNQAIKSEFKEMKKYN